MKSHCAAIARSCGAALVIVLAGVDAAHSVGAEGFRRTLSGPSLRATEHRLLRKGPRQQELPQGGRSSTAVRGGAPSGDLDNSDEDVEVEVEVEDDAAAAFSDAGAVASEQDPLAFDAVQSSSDEMDAKMKPVEETKKKVSMGSKELEMNEAKSRNLIRSAKETDELERAKPMLRDLKDARAARADLEVQLANFSDTHTFDEKLQADMKVVANQTESAGLARFLGDLRKEVRTVAGSSYIQHLEMEIAELKAKENTLITKINGTPAAHATSAEVRNHGGEKDGRVKRTKSEAEDVERETNSAGFVYAFAMFSTIIMLTMIFAMLHSSSSFLSNCTWFALDQVIAIFIAVMWFQCFDGLLDYGGMTGLSGALASVVHAVVVLVIALALAYILRGQDISSAILCGCGAHYVSFASMHAAAEIQANVWFVWNRSMLGCLVGFGALLLFLVLLGVAFVFAKRAAGMDSDDTLMDRTENLENDFGAMAAAFVFVLVVRFVISGHHPSGGAKSEFEHTALQRNLMLCYGVASVALAAGGFLFLSRVRALSESYRVQRVAKFASAFLVMNVAWAWLLWGEWEFYEGPYSHGPALFGEICFALAFTIVAAGMVFCMACLRVNPAAKIAIFAVSLVVAWAWEATFDAAVEHLSEGVTHPVQVKIIATLIISVVVLPVYALHLKPITMKAAEDID